MVKHKCDIDDSNIKESVYHDYALVFGYERSFLVWNLCAFQTIRR
jgi:hypothetical protein